MKKLVVILALLPLLFASCDKSSESSTSKNGTPLKIGVSTDPFASPDGVATRTVDVGYQTNFVAGDAIGLFVAENATPSTLVYTNVKWVFDGTVWAPAAAADRVAYGDKPLLITAYYPYASGLTAMPDAATFAVTPDQSTSANYAKSDLLLAAGVIWTASIVEPQLIFAHQMALLEVAAILLGQDGTSEPKAITLESGSLEASIGNGAAASAITLRVMPDGTLRALLPAQAVATAIVINDVLTYPITGELKLGELLRYKINITPKP